MRKAFWLVCILTVLAAKPAAQNMCPAELQNPPALHNLKLGMPAEQAQRATGKSLKIKNKKSGQYTFFQNFIKNSPPASLPGARAVYLRFFDGRLYQIEIFYEEKIRPQTLESFIANLSQRLNFPLSAWQVEYGIAEINCGKFSIIADNVLNPRVQLTDELVRAEVEKIRKNK